MLLLQGFEKLKSEHEALSKSVAENEDGGAAHAARLSEDLKAAEAELQTRALQLASMATKADDMRGELGMRERQLALVVTHLEAGQVDANALRAKGSAEEERLRGLLEERELQLVALVRELYDLAAIERAPGVVAHDARSRVFRRCASVYEALGEEAFRDSRDTPALS